MATARKILMLKKKEQIWTFLLEDDEIVEIHCCPLHSREEKTAALGDIYIGKVKNIAANIGAAFIEIEKGKECYYDISQAPHAIFTHKIGKKPLCIGDELVVQISREAVKTKAPTVSSNISFTGRYAVLTTGNTRIGTSGKLPKSLKDTYKERLSVLKNDEYGLIVRTNAKDVPFETVWEEIAALQDACRKLKETAPYRTCFSCLQAAPPSYITDLKNVYADGLTEIVVEDRELYEQIRDYFETEQPENLDKLRFYEDRLLSLSKLYNTDIAVERALREHVWLKNGGYLVIQPTEALTVIDVNSGKYSAKKKGPQAYLKINLEAAQEAARQIRLRNLSGIILIDFINLDDDETLQTLLKEFRRYLQADPIQTSLVDVTQLQLVEVTRKKVRRPLHECVSGRNLSVPERASMVQTDTVQEDSSDE